MPVTYRPFMSINAMLNGQSYTTHTHVHTCVHTHTRTHAYTHTHTQTYTHIHTHTHTTHTTHTIYTQTHMLIDHAYMCIHVCTCISVPFTCGYIYKAHIQSIHIRTCTYIHVCQHAHVHVHTCMHVVSMSTCTTTYIHPPTLPEAIIFDLTEWSWPMNSSGQAGQ